MSKATFFRTPDAFRTWLKRYHESRDELLVGFHRKDSGKPSLTWPESVDQALCFGWIDGVRRTIDETSYSIRFTPRRVGSIWSTVNIRRAQAMIDEGLMQPKGQAAFEARKENSSGIYSYEQRSVDLPDPYASILKKNKAAWSFFQKQPASYKKAANWWIISAKREETRLSRLEKLATCSAAGERLPQFRPDRPSR